ncbi:protransforming growth factor alpha [Scyliorhinus canicula]|uniref:protransforming growth factor alpha n=1 Tax=Scyliorhinus canicula TaxID=7830 RepID=UPI0018F7BE10|nr:protransforming growth factor alpha [Scyliorhinus canicula]
MGLLCTVCNSLENTTSPLTGPPVAAAVRAHFEDCPITHTHFCFHGTCRFLVQESIAACICHSGYIGERCEHADLLAVVAFRQKKQAITTLVVVSVIVSVLLIAVCVLLHCCRKRKRCDLCRRILSKPEASLLKSGSPSSHGDTGV